MIAYDNCFISTNSGVLRDRRMPVELVQACDEETKNTY